MAVLHAPDVNRWQHYAVTSVMQRKRTSPKQAQVILPIVMEISISIPLLFHPSAFLASSFLLSLPFALFFSF